MKKILVAVDGSEHAQKAMTIAASLAKEENSEVIVVHAASDKDVSRDLRQGILVEYGDEINQRLKNLNFNAPLPDETQYSQTMLSHSDSITQVVNTLAGENIIKRALSFLRNAGVANIQSYLIEGDPADVILEAREKHQADTIVMGCRGTGKLKGLLMGSVSQSVAHSADCSVVIVK